MTTRPILPNPLIPIRTGFAIIYLHLYRKKFLHQALKVASAYCCQQRCGKFQDGWRLRNLQMLFYFSGVVL
jgi:hypothetical protein